MKTLALYNQDGTLSTQAQSLISSKPDHLSMKEWKKILEDFRSQLSKEEVRQFAILKRKAMQKRYLQNNPEKVKASRQKSRNNPENRKKNQEYQRSYHKTYYKNDKDKYLNHLARCKRWAEDNEQQVKECRKAYCEANKEKINQQQKAYREANKEKIKAYCEANKEKAKEYQKQYRKENKERIKANKREYYKANKEKHIANSIEYRKNNKEKVNAYSRKYMKTHSQHNPTFKLLMNMRAIATRAVKQLGLGKKPAKTQELFGCSAEELKSYIESLFLEGMTWQNHGQCGWHIDHIRPVSSFSAEEIMQVNHYTNLQPLWALDNIKKSNKWE